jgi:hypothetical protein
MPIRPEHRRLYPFDWRQLSASVRFRRAKGRCERCGRPHGELVAHLGDGRWWDAKGGAWRNGKGRRLPKLPPLPAWPAELPRTRVILACAHLDHDPTNNAGSNLLALCQRCHLAHDREDNWWRRWRTLRSRRAWADLFLGPY